MKKFLTIATLFIGLAFSANAQKFGHLNSLDLYSLMPEVIAADSMVQVYAQELDGLLNDMYTEYDTKAKGASEKKQKGLLTPASEELVLKELADLEKRITDFQNSADAKIQDKQSKLLAPINEKVYNAVQKVAKANAYTYIFDVSSGALVYANQSDDVLPLIAKELGLKLPADYGKTPQ
ncbi:MAG: OmpH family outer membrane protein [Chitinophagales bacterium]|nr:OmpH family outer membrane protein [Chitinophagales bacterium]